MYAYLGNMFINFYSLYFPYIYAYIQKLKIQNKYVQ